ncbi:CMRF35-like molecule 5 [Centropristis striata]|uniref:CMRF35-like molecule 5 n=1 Tax=Centropristis striata TaxID=184440 RepID=UPI0027DF6401|nr:CMRF35-like molecule 5 [Centropristis striata]
MFTLRETNSGFNVSISNVSSQHAGVYWCGAESNEGSYRYALRKIQLEVKTTIRNITRYPPIGQNFRYFCIYPSGAPEDKFICKGEDPSLCEHLASTAHSKTTGRFSMIDEKNLTVITINVINITAEDAGTYWCGAESTDKERSNPFFNKCHITPIQPTTATFPVSSTQSTTASAKSLGGVLAIINSIVCKSVLLLLLLMMIFGLILILIYKRKRELLPICKTLNLH